MLDVLQRHRDALTSNISLELTYFSNMFIENCFITQGATNAVLTQNGIGARDKASQLLDRVTVNYETTLNKQEWAKKFIEIFSSQGAYADLATRLRRAAFPARP